MPISYIRDFTRSGNKKSYVDLQKSSEVYRLSYSLDFTIELPTKESFL